MTGVVVRPVNTPRERKIFLTFPWRIFKGDPLWVPPLLPDWAERIDPAQLYHPRGGYVSLGGGAGAGLCLAEYGHDPPARLPHPG